MVGAIGPSEERTHSKREKERACSKALYFTLEERSLVRSVGCTINTTR
jgi:hypothetical protein